MTNLDSDLSFTFHFHALEKEMATHSSVLAWRLPGTWEPGGLPSMGSHRVGHNWSDLAAAADSILKSWDITLSTKVCLVKVMVFPVVMYGFESWTIKKTEHQRIDAFELWCCRRLLRVPWTASRSNQSILKEISPGCSLEGLMPKLKLQYFGHLMRRADSFEKTLMLGKIKGRRRRGWQRMRWLNSIPTQWTWVWVGSRSWWWPGRPGMLQFMGLQKVMHNLVTERNWIKVIKVNHAGSWKITFYFWIIFIPVSCLIYLSAHYLEVHLTFPAGCSRLVLYATAWFVMPTFTSCFGSINLIDSHTPSNECISDGTNDSPIAITQDHLGLGSVVLILSLVIPHCPPNYTWCPWSFSWQSWQARNPHPQLNSDLQALPCRAPWDKIAVLAMYERTWGVF